LVGAVLAVGQQQEKSIKQRAAEVKEGGERKRARQKLSMEYAGWCWWKLGEKQERPAERDDDNQLLVISDESVRRPWWSVVVVVVMLILCTTLKRRRPRVQSSFFFVPKREAAICENSGLALNSALNIFAVPQTNVSVRRSFFREILPLSTISQVGPYLFRLFSDNLWTDLSRVYLHATTVMIMYGRGLWEIRIDIWPPSR
jgi:hypothetical protein